MPTVIEQPYIQRRSQVTSYIVISRNAKIKGPGAEILHNKQIVDLLHADNSTTKETIEKVQEIINNTYM